MNQTDPEIVAAAAAGRLFRSYESHCTDQNEDVLFELLNAIHSLADKLNKFGRPNLNSSRNYLALRALRNLFHHEAELLHETRSIYASNVPQIHTDLALLCLVPKTSIDRILERARDDAERAAITAVLHWYGPAVDIEPAIFNAMVDVYELLRDKGVTPAGASFARFDSQYKFESLAGHDHRVNGALSARAGDVGSVLRTLLASPRPPET